MGLTQITSDGITDATIATADLADQSVTLAKLPHGTSSNDGKFLRANNGADPTFETVNTDLVSDTSPQLGGDLDVNGKKIKFPDLTGSVNNILYFGTGEDLLIYHLNDINYIQCENARTLRIQQWTGSSNETLANFIPNGAVELYHNNSKKFETTSGGIEVSGGANFTSGNISLLDNSKIKLGNADDLQIYHDGSDSFIKDAGTGGLYIHTNQFLVRNAAGSQPNMEIQDNGQVFVPEVYNRTTGSSVNMRVDSDGELRRSTSSKRYKKDITDATWGLAELLKLRPITYKSNATGKDADDKTYGGFIAEDVHDLGLTEFVDYNEKNEPDALAYGNMVALMAKAIQDLNAKVEALEAA